MQTSKHSEFNSQRVEELADRYGNRLAIFNGRRTNRDVDAKALPTIPVSRSEFEMFEASLLAQAEAAFKLVAGDGERHFRFWTAGG